MCFHFWKKNYSNSFKMCFHSKEGLTLMIQKNHQTFFCNLLTLIPLQFTVVSSVMGTVCYHGLIYGPYQSYQTGALLNGFIMWLPAAHISYRSIWSGIDPLQIIGFSLSQDDLLVIFFKQWSLCFSDLKNNIFINWKKQSYEYVKKSVQCTKGNKDL